MSWKKEKEQKEKLKKSMRRRTLYHNNGAPMNQGINKKKKERKELIKKITGHKRADSKARRLAKRIALGGRK